jgi:competence protein ComEC
VSAAAVAILIALLLWSPFRPRINAGQLELAAIDVGQGESLFVAMPDGKRMLVDGGGLPSFGRPAETRMEIGEDVVAPYLWERGIRSLDVIVASHGHEDHIGGLPALIADFHPKELWTGAGSDGDAWRAVREAAARNGVKLVPMAGPRRFRWGGAELEVLAPLPDYVPSDTPKNNDSLVLRVAFGKRAFLLTGDIERPIERRMIEENELRSAEVLKAPHHGSRTSSTEEFLEAVSPAFSVISAGFENSYGNPHPETLDRLKASGSMVFRTDLDGLVSIRTDGRRLWVETHRETGGSQLAPAWSY